MPSSVRSALTSKVVSPPLCTPPNPPDTKIRIPAACASTIVPDIVVPPVKPCKYIMGVNDERRDFIVTIAVS